MAYRRSISARATLLARWQFSPSFSYIHHEDDRRHREDRVVNTPVENRSFSGGINTLAGLGTSIREKRCSQFSVTPMAGSFFVRYMSTTVGKGVDKIDYITDVSGMFAEKTVDAVATTPAVNEVAIAAADSAFPVAALQHFIDNVHSFTGLNWWASIVVTTLLIRTATVPLLINQLKSSTKLSLLRPKLEEIKEEMQNKAMDPKAVADGQQRMQALFKEYGVSPFSPLKGLLFQGPVFISFFLAISNMVEKVPSFKHGGVYWFTDLSTPDSLYIFPALTALTFWITVEFNLQEGMEGNPAAKTMKNVSRIFAALTVPVTMGFPKAIFCYWLTSNFFSLMYGLVLKASGVKKFLGVPELPVGSPSTTSQQPSFSVFDAIKKYVAAQQATSSPVKAEPASLLVKASKPTAERRTSSSSAISQRIRSLEKQLQGRKKNKR
ncbi:hypothetical protein NMG60_11030540 [Bertholletia excelsa]